MNPLHDLRVAAGFLTRVPVGDVSAGGDRPVRMARAVPWFPVVGLAVGALEGGVFVGLLEVVSPPVAAAVAVTVALLVTGAFHHDGLADVADAFGGGWTREQRFEILKDSRLGTYGTAALAMALIIEVAAISALDGLEAFSALVVAHALGRAMAVAAMVLAPTAGDGMGASYMADLSVLRAMAGVVVGLAANAFLFPGHPLAALGAGAVMAALVVVLAVRKIGGINGDVLGAVHVVTMLAVLVSAT
ncbi:MAG: adenosylcobinamide-GDP ribazoletransferase [Acidimicrobiales bacterium]